MGTILYVEGLRVKYPIKYGLLGNVISEYNAVNGVSFDINYGETVGFIGESGSGKSSIAKALIGLVPMKADKIVFDFEYNIHNFKSEEDWLKMRQKENGIQFVFQNYISSLDDCKTIGEIIAEPLYFTNKKLTNEEIKNRVLSMMSKVKIDESLYYRHPSSFSGGQCQRINIARALITNPKILICDEAVSALDLNVQAQIINLLKDIQKDMNLTIIFISHDLSIIKYICDRVYVMYNGYIVEKATTENLFSNPQHPYTKLLLSSTIKNLSDNIFKKNNDDNKNEIDYYDNREIKRGCPFQNRCKFVKNKCRIENPKLQHKKEGYVACWEA